VATEVEPLRTACQQAVRRSWFAVGVGSVGPARVPPDTHGSSDGHGVDMPVSLIPGPLRALPLLVAGCLCGQAAANTVTGELPFSGTPYGLAVREQR